MAPPTYRSRDPAAIRAWLEPLIAAARERFLCVGIRTADEPAQVAYLSHAWVDGEPTDEELDGISATDVDSGDVWVQHLPATADERRRALNTGTYYGDHIALLGSDSASRGVDPGEVVMRDFVVVARAMRAA